MLPSLYCACTSTIILTSRSTSLSRWKALPNRAFFLSLVVSVLTGLRPKLKSRWRKVRLRRWMSRLRALYPCRTSCSAASIQSSSVVWKNFVFFSSPKETVSLLWAGCAVMQCVEQLLLQQLLVTHSRLNGQILGTTFAVPIADEGHVHCPSVSADAVLVDSRREQHLKGSRCVTMQQRHCLKQRCRNTAHSSQLRVELIKAILTFFVFVSGRGREQRCREGEELISARFPVPRLHPKEQLLGTAAPSSVCCCADAGD